VYWAQTTLLKQIARIDDDLAGCGNVDDLAAYLKVRGLVIVCGAGTLAIEPAIREPRRGHQPRITSHSDKRKAVAADQAEGRAVGAATPVAATAARPDRDPCPSLAPKNKKPQQVSRETRITRGV
jgi:hypothetical protein